MTTISGPSSLRSCETALCSDASAVRGASAPQQVLDEPVDGDGLSGAKREEREQRPLPPLANRDSAVALDHDRPEEEHVHRRLVTPERKRKSALARD